MLQFTLREMPRYMMLQFKLRETTRYMMLQFKLREMTRYMMLQFKLREMTRYDVAVQIERDDAVYEPDVNKKYQEEVSYKLAQLPNKLNSVEKEWLDFKDIIQRTAEKMVGQKKSGGGQLKKATPWWNEETRQATKSKKQLYNKWLKDPTTQNKEQYQSARDACKQVIKQAKERAWSEYGNQLEDMRKTEAMKSFYKKVKSLREREQPYCPITTIKDAQGQIITDKHQIKQRWGGYFEGLLNPNEEMRDNNFSAQDILELRSEFESLKLD